MKVALVCIAKNEENYIDEWIQYNKKLGFDDIFVYQNDWRFQNEYENVYKIDFDGPSKQIPAYNHFIKNHYNDYDWTAFFDVDEFLVLKKHNNIKDFIEDYKDYDAIGINTILFGNNGLDKVEDGNYSVLKRFTMRHKKMDYSIKTILKLQETSRMKAHDAPGVDTVNTSYEISRGIFNNHQVMDVAQLNHYYCKTKEEFEIKLTRGRVDTIKPEFQRDFNYYLKNNHNDVEDLLALNFFNS